MGNPFRKRLNLGLFDPSVNRGREAITFVNQMQVLLAARPTHLSHCP